MKPRGVFTGDAWAMCCSLLVTAHGLSILFWHILGHFTAPCPGCRLLRGTCAGEVDTSVPALPMDTLMCIGSSLTAAGDPKRRHRGVSGGREDSALGRHQALHGHLRERGHKGDTWTTIRKTCECSCSDIPYQPDDPAASKAAGGTSHTSGDNISVPSAHCQTQVSLQAPREARQ